jgi:hypothetical protein
MKKVLFLLTAISGLFLASCKTQEVDPSTDILASMQASSARSAADADPVTKEKCKGKLTAIQTMQTQPSNLLVRMIKDKS